MFTARIRARRAAGTCADDRSTGNCQGATIRQIDRTRIRRTGFIGASFRYTGDSSWAVICGAISIFVLGLHPCETCVSTRLSPRPTGGAPLFERGDPLPAVVARVEHPLQI